MENQPPAPQAPDGRSTPPRLARRLDQLPSNRNRNVILYGVIALLVVAGLLLPPISLLDRIFVPCGELEISSASPAARSPDGLTVQQAAANQSYRLSIRAILEAELDSKTPPETLAGAREALPVNLLPVGGVYQITVCGDKRQAGVVQMEIPANAQPVDTLDLYSWNAKSKEWIWIGSTHDAAANAISASVDELPAAVALMQTTSAAPAVGVELETADSLDANLLSSATELYLTGLVIAPDGTLGGDHSELPAAANTQAAYPLVRNYLTRGQPNPDLVRGVLGLNDTRQTHIDSLVDLASDGRFAGVTLDYQGLTDSDLDLYTAFVSDLSEALHGQGKRLIVVLPAPSITTGGATDTAGYDWRRIGLAADAVQSPISNPAMIEWATSQVNRYKLQPILSAASAEMVNNLTSAISFRQAIERLGVVSTTQAISVTSNSIFTFTLQADVAISAFQLDDAAKVYRYEYADRSGLKYVVTIRTAAALAGEVAGTLPHNVRGLVVRGAEAPGVADVLKAYRQQSAASVSPELTINWQVKSGNQEVAEAAKPLSESWYSWRAPLEAGAYLISAAIAGLDRGAVEVTVNAATQDEVKSVTAGVGTGGGSTNGGNGALAGAAAGSCYGADYVADVTVPDGTHFDNNKEFTKTWKVRNSGTCTWNADTEIAFVSGSQLGGPSTVKVGALEPGKEIEISVAMKTSEQDGNFTGVWQLRNEDGFYGDPLTVVIQAGEAVAAAPAATRIGNIGSFEAGAHIDGFGRPDLLKSAGLNWIKIQTFAGADVSGAINNAHAQGFKILLGVLGDKERVMDAGYQQEYAQAVAGMAAAGADAIEVWNEPNINREWPTGQVNGANYTALLAKAYPAIKAANPGTLVISGAPAPTGFWGAAGCSPDGCNDDAFLAQMAAAGAANYMDCVGAHHNAGATAPSATSGHPAGSHYSWYFLPTLNLYYNAFGGARKVCFTELGYLTDDGMPSTLEQSAPAFAWASNVTLAQQAAWLAEAAAMSANSGKVRLMIIWNADFTRYDSDPMAGYAIIRPDGSCPACNALRSVLGSR